MLYYKCGFKTTEYSIIASVSMLKGSICQTFLFALFVKSRRKLDRTYVFSSYVTKSFLRNWKKSTFAPSSFALVHICPLISKTRHGTSLISLNHAPELPRWFGLRYLLSQAKYHARQSWTKTGLRVGCPDSYMGRPA